MYKFFGVCFCSTAMLEVSKLLCASSIKVILISFINSRQSYLLVCRGLILSIVIDLGGVHYGTGNIHDLFQIVNIYVYSQ